MTRISSYTALQSGVSGIFEGQSRMNLAQAQASSQTKANDLKGYGEDAKKLINAKSLVNRVQSRTEDLKSLQARATVEATAYSSFTEAVESVRSAVGTAIANQNGGGFRTAIEGALQSAITAANVQFGGQTIFGGVRSYDEPIISASLDDLAALANTDANFIDTGPNRTVTLEDGRTLEISKNAEEVFKPFIDLLRDIRVWENANGNIDGKLNQTQISYLQGLIPQVSTVQNNVLSLEGNAGVLAKEIDNTIENNEAKLTKLNEIISDIQNVDLTEVAARLSAAQTQYQASAAIFGQLKDLSLLNYLR